MKVAGVDLGISSEKVWGAVDVLCFTLGATYYWGEGSLNSQAEARPNRHSPILLGYEDIPIGYNEETDQTLYMRIGTNTSLIASNIDDERVAVLMSIDGKAYLKSNSSKTEHEFDLGAKQGENDALVQITVAAENKADVEESGFDANSGWGACFRRKRGGNFGEISKPAAALGVRKYTVLRG